MTPGASNLTKVTVSGKIQITCPQGTVPNAEDLLAQVFLFANSCNVNA